MVTHAHAEPHFRWPPGSDRSPFPARWLQLTRRATISTAPQLSNHPPAKPGAFVHEPLEAATGSLTRPAVLGHLKVANHLQWPNCSIRWSSGSWMRMSSRNFASTHGRDEMAARPDVLRDNIAPALAVHPRLVHRAPSFEVADHLRNRVLGRIGDEHRRILGISTPTLRDVGSRTRLPGFSVVGCLGSHGTKFSGGTAGNVKLFRSPGKAGGFPNLLTDFRINWLRCLSGPSSAEFSKLSRNSPGTRVPGTRVEIL
jgi:hypothetical protein